MCRRFKQGIAPEGRAARTGHERKQNGPNNEKYGRSESLSVLADLSSHPSSRPPDSLAWCAGNGLIACVVECLPNIRLLKPYSSMLKSRLSTTNRYIHTSMSVDVKNAFAKIYLGVVVTSHTSFGKKVTLLFN